MKKKFAKIALCFIIALVCIFSNVFIYNVHAEDGGKKGGSTGESTGGSGFDWMGMVEDVASGQADENVTTPLTGLAGEIITIVRVICAGVAIIMLVVLGIKYMVSAPNDRATIMKHAWIYLVGAVILFASNGILGIIAKFAASL